MTCVKIHHSEIHHRLIISRLQFIRLEQVFDRLVITLDLVIELRSLKLRFKVLRLASRLLDRRRYFSLHTAGICGGVRSYRRMITREVLTGGRRRRTWSILLIHRARKHEADDESKQDPDYREKEVL